MHTMRLIGLFFILLMAGCAGVARAPESGAPAKAVAVEPSKTDSTNQGVAKAPAKLPADQPGKMPGATTSSGKPGAPPLDLTALEIRLKQTKAIGVLTKIALKNQVDDLLDQFRAYYQKHNKTAPTELRQLYDRLLLKVLSLLQDGDPELARAIVASRDTIWGILADPAKFATLST